MLTPAERRNGAFLLGLMLVGTLLETLSIGLVIPAVALMASTNLGTQPWVRPYIEALGAPSQVELVAGGMIALAGVFLIKTLFLGVVVSRQATFTYGVRLSLSRRLFAGYLRQPWIFHLDRNSARLIRNVTGEVDELAGVLQSVIMVATETLVLAGVAVILLLVEPVGAGLVVMTLLGAAWLFYRIFKHRTLRWGLARQEFEARRLQHLQEGLGGAKEVKLLGREAEFLAQYDVPNKGSGAVGARQATLQQMPRLLLEFLAVLGLVALVLIMLSRGKPFDAILPILGLFGAAAFRLMPSVNRVMGAIQTLRYGLPAVERLTTELALVGGAPPPVRGRPLPFVDAIELEQVTYAYPAAAGPSLLEVSLKISCRTSVGIIGESGAGKSTLVDIILGLLKPGSGRLTVDGSDIHGNLRGWQDQIGYVPQTIFVTDDTLRRNIAFGVADADIDAAAVSRAVRAAQLESLVASLPRGLDAMVGEHGARVSGGQRQRIGIARALYHDPAVLVLDEATSALDSATEQDVMEAVWRLHGEKTVVIVAHRLSTVSRCDRLLRLSEGRLVDGHSTPSEMGPTRAPRLAVTGVEAEGSGR